MSLIQEIIIHGIITYVNKNIKLTALILVVSCLVILIVLVLVVSYLVILIVVFLSCLTISIHLIHLVHSTHTIRYIFTYLKPSCLVIVILSLAFKPFRSLYLGYIRKA